VDVKLYDLGTGAEVEMPGPYDEMSERSFVTYSGGTPEQRRVRDVLRAEMERDGSLTQFKLQVRDDKCIAKLLESAKNN
jgi:D-alanyl-D-alanine dipeptidase